MQDKYPIQIEIYDVKIGIFILQVLLSVLQRKHFKTRETKQLKLFNIAFSLRLAS